VVVVVDAWAERELGYWRGVGLRRLAVERQVHAIAARRPEMRLYQFVDGGVAMLPAAAPEQESRGFRAAHYLAFFRAVAPLLPADINVTLCVCLDDRVTAAFPVPVFCFQRTAHEHNPLLPDIDFLTNDFHEAERFNDKVGYFDKAMRAVFAGATTGGRITSERARACSLPRLAAARFFEACADVDFRLPRIVQCADDEAREILEGYEFCRRPRMIWPDQFRHRFLISMDGNGATCARVAMALASNSVLLKYESEHMLFYFPALVAGEHYVPVSAHEDVLAVIAAEQAQPGRYAAVAAAGRAFAERYLTRARLTEYTAFLVRGYAALLAGEDGDAGGPARQVACAGRFADGTESVGDRNGWVERPGGGALTAFRVLTQPRAEAPRLLCQGLLADGGFTPVMREGVWCGGGALAGIRVEAVAPGVAVSVEARYADGSVARGEGGTVTCQSGAAMAAFRVTLR
jgi:hypothetical protein